MIGDLSDQQKDLIRTRILGDGFSGLVYVAHSRNRENSKVLFHSHIHPDSNAKLIYEKTPIPLGDSTKLIMAFLTRELARQNYFDIEEPVTKYLTDFPYPEVKIKHLLHHTSGIPKLAELEIKEPFKKKTKSIEFITQNFQLWKTPLAFGPGEYWKYSKLDFTTLRILLEKVSKQDIASLLNQKIFLPLHMENCKLDETDPLLGNSGIFCTYQDILVLHREILYPKVLNKSDVNEIYSKTELVDEYAKDKIAFGEGVFVGDGFFWQYGKTGKVSTFIYLDHNSKLSIILVNAYGASLGQMASAKSHVTEIIFNSKRLSFYKAKEGEETIEDLLGNYKVSNVGIAVYKNYKLDWAKNYGKGAEENSLFRAGSLTKPVVATIAVKLSEINKLSLFLPWTNRLAEWKIKSDLKSSEIELNLDSLLSHTSGLTEKGEWDLPENQNILNFADIKDGYREENGIKIYYKTDSKSRYSGAGYSLIQAAIEDVTKKSLAQNMNSLIGNPLHWKFSTFDQEPNPKKLPGHDIDGNTIPEKKFIYPELGSGGLWTTPTEIGQLFVEVGLASQGKSSFLSKKSARYLLRPKMSAANLTVHASVARGFFLNQTGKETVFFHGGHTKGHKSLAWFQLESGNGVVIMTNSETGSAVIWKILRELAIQKNWDKFVN